MMVDNAFTSPGVPPATVHPSQQPSTTQNPPAPRSRWLHAGLIALFIAGAVALALRGWEFYTLGLGQRVDHPDFRVLSPGQSWGRLYGITASLLFLTNLSYLLRRRFARLSVGSLKGWLDLHAFTGLFGGLLVVFHSAFQARSHASLVTLISMGVVLVTGVIGRFLYSLSPRGRGAEWHEATLELEACVPGLGTALRSQLMALPITPPPRRPSFIRSLATLPIWQRDARRRAATVSRICRQVLGNRPAEAELLAPSIRRCCRAARAQATAVGAGAILDSWRGLHRLSALLMTLVVVLHIGIAWYYGFATMGLLAG